jgi:putative heme-binding domain-containing protein
VRTARDPQREQFVAQMRTLVRSADGDPVQGAAVFKKVCAQCHKIYGEGADVGPDITSNGRNEFEQLLSNVFDPSLVIGAAFQAVTVVTTDGRSLTGLLTEEGDKHVVIKLAGGAVQTVPRDEIDTFTKTVASMMPEGLRSNWPQEMVDLFSFLNSTSRCETRGRRWRSAAGEQITEFETARSERRESRFIRKPGIQERLSNFDQKKLFPVSQLPYKSCSLRVPNLARKTFDCGPACRGIECPAAMLTAISPGCRGSGQADGASEGVGGFVCWSAFDQLPHKHLALGLAADHAEVGKLESSGPLSLWERVTVRGCLSCYFPLTPTLSPRERGISFQHSLQNRPIGLVPHRHADDEFVAN